MAERPWYGPGTALVRTVNQDRGSLTIRIFVVIESKPWHCDVDALRFPIKIQFLLDSLQNSMLLPKFFEWLLDDLYLVLSTLSGLHGPTNLPTFYWQTDNDVRVSRTLIPKTSFVPGSHDGLLVTLVTNILLTSGSYVPMSITKS